MRIEQRRDRVRLQIVLMVTPCSQVERMMARYSLTAFLVLRLDRG
jgi:hypothetical protein